jgi:C-terminal processing protease CtpA/Prc
MPKMRNSVPAALVALLAVTLVIADEHSPQDRTTFGRENLVGDFRLLQRVLEEGHSGLYRYTSKAEMDQVFAAAEKSLDRPMDAVEFYRVVAPAVAAIKCGHTSVQLPDALRPINTRAPLLPLKVRVLDQRVFVFRDLATADHRWAGKEILTINGVPSSRIVKTMLAATPADGDVITSKQFRISGWQFCANLATLMALNSPYDVALADTRTGQSETVRLEGMGLRKLMEASNTLYGDERPSQAAADLKFLEEGKIAALKIRQFDGFADEDKKKDLRTYLKESFEEMQAKTSQTLIIDLRNNGGGEDELPKALFSYLTDTPFKYYDDLVLNKLTYDFFDVTKEVSTAGLSPSKMFQQGKDGKYHMVGHPNWGLNNPSKPTFTGKVLVLMNGGSFSGAAEFISVAHFHKRAVFIGEESGGGYDGNSSGFMPVVTLPATKLSIRVPLVTYYMAVKRDESASRGLAPDYLVAYRIDEIIRGKDKEMELALKLAKSN